MRRFLLIILSSLMIFGTGCWDQQDIETRGYVLGIAIDKYPPMPGQAGQTEPDEATPEEEKELEEMALHTGEPAYAMTVQLPLIKKSLSTQASSGGGSASAGSKTWEITQVGNSFLSMNREMRARTNLSLYYAHLQVIVISDVVARDGIENILDFYIRDPEMRRRVKIFITPGKAKKILDVVPRAEDYSSIYLAHLPRNAVANSRMIHKTDLGEVIQFIHEGYDFVLPKVISTKDEIKASGGAVFKKDKLVGWLNELELEATKLIRNEYLGGVITVKIPGEKGLYVLDVKKSKSKINPVFEGDRLRFVVEVTVEGNYGEELNTHTHGNLGLELLKKMEKAIEHEIKQICMKTIKKAQKELKCDFFQFNRVIETKEPRVWKQIKDEWDTVFLNIEVKIKPEVKLKLIGVVQ